MFIEYEKRTLLLSRPRAAAGGSMRQKWLKAISPAMAKLGL
jgi:hypothetical protein